MPRLSFVTIVRIVTFAAHIELLQFFIARRDQIVERIEGLLNAQRKPAEYLRDAPLLSRYFEDCFFIGATQDQARLRGQLEEAHWTRGFKPREIEGLQNGLAEPAEMMVRVFHLWQRTRWPGRNGRVHYAHTLFNLYLIRCLTLLIMRLWDDGSDTAGDRLSQVQGVLDQLWRSAPAEQPALVRDARWLIPMAQSPATDDLGAYFDVAAQIAGSLSDEDRLAIHKANVRMAAGHLRSQIRYYSINKAVPFDEASLILLTRNSNALDFALLIQDLVPLLEAYQRACSAGNEQTRRELADVVCQGLSPDPELFLNRVPLLGAYSMIEHLFVTTDHDGQAAYTPMGQRHVDLFRKYEALIDRLSGPLNEDCPQFRPVAGAYSPYGLLYGYSSDLLEHMALKTSQPGAIKDFSLVDAFTTEGDSAGTLAWVSGWRQLPHLTPDIRKLFDYPQQFAEEIFGRLQNALSHRVSTDADAHVQVGRLFILPLDSREADSKTSAIPDLPVRFLRSSDRQIVAEQKARPYNEVHLLNERREGKTVVSYKTPGGWMAVSKDILTDVLGAGLDAGIAVPPEAAATVALMCPGLVVFRPALTPND